MVNELDWWLVVEGELVVGGWWGKFCNTIVELAFELLDDGWRMPGVARASPEFAGKTFGPNHPLFMVNTETVN